MEDPSELVPEIPDDARAWCTRCGARPTEGCHTFYGWVHAARRDWLLHAPPDASLEVVRDDLRAQQIAWVITPRGRVRMGVLTDLAATIAGLSCAVDIDWSALRGACPGLWPPTAGPCSCATDAPWHDCPAHQPTTTSTPPLAAGRKIGPSSA